jgi:ABC-type antimicrobial peptide transport system permease subunit
MKVISQYKFTSLSSLNAVLGLYNVTADRGEKDSRIYRNNGLTYRILDAGGNKTGVPIKASSFYMKPTMKFLENKFNENEKLGNPHIKRIQTQIDWLLNKKPISTNEFKNQLEKENMSMVIWKNKENIIYGITYIDHQTKCVFNGSDLGKQYSAKGIIERCKPDLASREKEAPQLHEKAIKTQAREMVITPSINLGSSKILDNLSEPIPSTNYIPYQLKKARKKKRRKRLS